MSEGILKVSTVFQENGSPQRVQTGRPAARRGEAPRSQPLVQPLFLAVPAVCHSFCDRAAR